MNKETDSEREEREFQEYTAKYCTPNVCSECNMCIYCDECECLPKGDEKE